MINSKKIKKDLKEEEIVEDIEKDLAEGEIVEVYITKIVNEDDKTSGQLAKVHACIRELARETGHTFEEMKETVKEKAGKLADKAEEFAGNAVASVKEKVNAFTNDASENADETVKEETNRVEEDAD